ncbi:MAG: adenylate kinase [Ruminococcaceae bacterium]|nr:adenylate kinase [Oscillospiraceae bacterium]
MNLMLLGAPGAGKGTQAVELAKLLGIPQVSTGDIFRANIKGNTELGKLASSYISKGMLVPDEVTFDIVKDRLLQDDCKNGVILDGFPRTIAQADMLDKFFAEIGRKLDYVVNIVVDDAAVVARLSRRRICPDCKQSFHLDFAPPAGEKCTNCGGTVVQRPDDVEEVIMQRLQEYHKQTAPLVEYYKEKGILVDSESVNDIEQALQNTKNAIGV